MIDIKKIDYRGLRNTRDLGQFETIDGRKVKVILSLEVVESINFLIKESKNSSKHIILKQ